MTVTSKPRYPKPKTTFPKPTLVSPNQIMKAAKDEMLEGNEPKNPEEWVLIMNFVAFNLMEGVEIAASELFRLMYEIPLPKEIVEEIAKFQVASKKELKNGIKT